MKQLDQDSLLLHVNFVLGDGSSLSFPFKLHRTNTKLTLGRLFWLRTDGLLASGFCSFSQLKTEFSLTFVDLPVGISTPAAHIFTEVTVRALWNVSNTSMTDRKHNIIIRLIIKTYCYSSFLWCANTRLPFESLRLKIECYSQSFWKSSPYNNMTWFLIGQILWYWWAWPPYLGLISRYNWHDLKQPRHLLQYHLQGHCQPEPRSQTTRERNKELSNANHLILVNTLKPRILLHCSCSSPKIGKSYIKPTVCVYAYLVWTVILNGSLCKDPFISVIFSSLTPNQPFRFACLEDDV